MRDYQSNLIFLCALIVLALISYFIEAKSERTEVDVDEQMIALAHMQDYGAFYSLAEDSDEREALQQLEADDSMGFGAWTREALMIVGELPRDQARLTLQDAEKIVAQTAGTDSIVEKFNGIAGAPDWQGGSGADRKIYFLDESKSEAVIVLNGVSASHVIYERGIVKEERPLTGS
ncbi:hypothetical protein [Paenibacillus soyae]|uniref:Uncharacterized protein n=1 Tax=Paenibacillus soyae TaxID=2969249 RepID=A0A9X2MUK1_9BACL|nr:hypothetical protein [Paenibacillus soyae]MCR2807296.1 hypothetical protein [Paenibacillus soyae]